MQIPFAKYSGCGNDFIIVDNRNHSLEKHFSTPFIRRLCHRLSGIGADGILLLQNSTCASFQMRIFNSDGSEAEMCGNGIRCLTHFIHRFLGISGEFFIDTMHQQIRVHVVDGDVSILMPLPTSFSYSIDLPLSSAKLLVHFLDTGVPHVVSFVNDIEDECLINLAKEIRFHPKFSPKGTNVNFATLSADHCLTVRTYERGVEAETLACGTGALAVAIAARHLYQLNDRIKIKTRSGEFLDFSFDLTPSNILMKGPVSLVLEGEIYTERD